MELYFIKSEGIFINADMIRTVRYYEGNPPHIEICLEYETIILKGVEAEVLKEALLKKSYAV